MYSCPSVNKCYFAELTERAQATVLFYKEQRNHVFTSHRSLIKALHVLLVFLMFYCLTALFWNSSKNSHILHTICANNRFLLLASSVWALYKLHPDSPARLFHAGLVPSSPDQPFHRIIIDRKSGPAEWGTFPPDSRSDIGTDNKQLFSTGSAVLHNPYWPSLFAIQLYF